ncbi:hypothetical protein niasHS_007659 [Heterodera schachtii]|uniref:Poly(A) polymerase nucleotidyltransferase domain-containing protein n=1 Tax=Heterodera schachtii TaxID=97005 RepID=A0ABD2JPA3_HETSC
MMKLLLLVFVLLLHFALSNDEEINEFADILPLFTEMRFIYNQIGGSQHILLDRFYKKYFTAENESERKKAAQKIGIYIHIYFLSYKIEQNKEKLANILVAYLEEEEEKEEEEKQNKKGTKAMKKGPKPTITAKAFYQRRMLRLMFNNRLELDFNVMDLFDTHFQKPKLFCELLRLKAELLTTINANGTQRVTMARRKEWPNCKNEEEIKETIVANEENIKEWVFSDIFHFLPTRKKLLQYFDEIKLKKRDLISARIGFINLIGFSRMAILCKKYSDQLPFLVPLFDNGFYLKLYENYLIETNWRNKITLAKFLYDEWATKTLSTKRKRPSKQKANFVVIQFEAMFLSELKYLWQLYTQNFWSNEKIIRIKNESFLKETMKGKALKNASESLSAHQKQLEELAQSINEMDQFLWWDNGPTDTFLLRALAICANGAIDEFGKKFPNSRAKNGELEEFTRECQCNFLICVGKTLRKNTRRDEFLSDLHFQKIDNLINDRRESETFRGMLIDHKHLWSELLDSNAIKKLRVLLTEEINYLTPPEFLSSSSSEKELFWETQDEFEGEREGSCAKNGQTIKNEQSAETQNGQIAKTESEIWQMIKSTEKNLANEKKNDQRKRKKVYKKSQKNEQNSMKIEKDGEKEFKQTPKQKKDKVPTGQNVTNGKVKTGKIKGEEPENGQKNKTNLMEIKEENSEEMSKEEKGTKEALERIGIERIFVEGRKADTDLSEKINQFIALNSIGMDKKRKTLKLLQKIESIVKEWAIQFTKSEAKLLKNGSHLLNAELQFSDFDLICVVSDEINLSHFNGQSDETLYVMLGKRLGAVINWVGGRVPLIRIESGQVEIDLLLVPVKKKFLENQMELESDQIIAELSDECAVYSLSGYRSTIFQLSLLNDHNTFASFDWHRSQLLIDQISRNSLNNFASLWPPTVAGCPMAIITPKFPEQNATYNVNTFTFQTIVNELKIANQKLSENPNNWQMIFEEIEYLHKFEHYAVILCLSTTIEFYRTNCGYQKSKIRQKLFNWAKSEENSEKLDNYQLITQSERKTKCKMTNDFAFCTVWLVGLTLSSAFRQNVNALGPIYRQRPNHDSLSASSSFWLLSLYTDKDNLIPTINQLISQ